MNKSYGHVELGGNQWMIKCEPHVMIKLKGVFGQLRKDKAGVARVSNTVDNCRDLLWFIGRYPMTVKPLEKLMLGDKLHRRREAMVTEVLGEGFKPRDFQMALPPRNYQAVAAELMLRSGSLLLGDDVGLGKQHPVDTKVLTPTGWREVGALVVGDMVIGSNGKATRVTGVFPQGVMQNFRLHFSDGASVEAGDEHLWTVGYWKGGRRFDQVTLTTRQLRSEDKIGTLSPSKTKFYLPMLAAPAEFNPVTLPLPAYLTGQLIANGGLTHSIALTTNAADWPEIRSRLIADGVNIGSVHQYGNALHAGVIGIRALVAELGMNVHSAEKRIPRAFMVASPRDRIALLQGLMDGDGSVSKERNRVTYSTTSPGLAADIEELIEGLGGNSGVREYDRTSEGKPVEYQVRVRLPVDIEPFSTRRKASRLGGDRRPPTRSLIKVEPSRVVESVCIRVEADDHLYVTEHAILTHNTASFITLLTDVRTRPAVIVTLTHLPNQWKREIDRFLPGMNIHIAQKGTPPPGFPLNGKIPDVVIINYHKLDGWAPTLAKFVHSVCFDEIQELRSGMNTNKDGDPPRKYVAAGHLVRNAHFRVGLSATPIYNYGGEIFAVLNMLKEGCLGTYEEFIREHCSSVGSGKHKIDEPRAFGHLLRREGLMLRRTRADVGRELPPVQQIHHAVETDAKAFNDVSADLAALARKITSSSTLREDRFKASGELDWKLRQATGVAKAPYVADFVRLIAESGEQILLYAWHREVYSILMEKLSELKPIMYTGSESVPQKEEAKLAFVEGRSRVLVMSLRAGAGLDGLQNVCSTVVFGELDWSPGVHEQCEGRIARDGQTKPVQAYYLLADEGSDPVVSEVLGLKQAQIEGIRNPNADLFSKLQSDGGHIRKLAEDFLRRRNGGR